MSFPMLPSTKLRVLAASSDRFGALYYPYCLTSHALRSVLPLPAQGLLLVARLMPYQVGFPPTCYAILLLGALTPHIVKRKSLTYNNFFLPRHWEFQQTSFGYGHFSALNAPK
jgi:hypothetical protein